MHYTFTDHQGSLAAYTGNAKEPVTRLSYDAWGRRRNAEDGSYGNVPALATDRGYTGHEHLDAFGLINMNGRLYDPMLGRMLSPDIVVQQTDYTQSYNRYSYCFNNPLRFTDPTGWVTDWYEKNGKIIWDDNVTCPANTPTEGTYIGHNDKDILKHFGLKERYERQSESRFGFSLDGVSMEDDHNGVSYKNQRPGLAPFFPSDNVSGTLTTSVEVAFDTDEVSGTNKKGKTFEGISFSFILSQSALSMDFKGGAGVFYDDKLITSRLEQRVESSIEKDGYQYTKAHISIPADDIKSKDSFKNAQIRVGAVSNSFFICPRPVEMNWSLYAPDTNPKHYTFKYYFLYEK